MQRSSRLESERGAVVIFIAVAMVLLLAMLAFVVDFGRVYLTRVELQNTVDAAAMAAVVELPSPAQAEAEAVLYGQLNYPGTIVSSSDVTLGHWDVGSKTFQPGASPVNAVQVWAERSEARGNPVDMLFARILGFDEFDVAATAIAYESEISTRFLIDSEMFDTDIPAIQDAAVVAGVTSDELLEDDDGDWFIDFYRHAGGITIELPTGQIGDEALFDIDQLAFPFPQFGTPAFEDFLNYNEDGSWRQNLLPQSVLDPLLGVIPVNDPGRYGGFVEPTRVHVSPVYKSDVNYLGFIGGNPAVNALGERRGLVAFRIVGVGTDPDGAGSKMPNLVIRLVDPATVSLGDVPPASDPVFLVG